ncbi:MAG: hypothetical protein HY040_19135 [Planctomycetes bacterium]|nr:hypothetical protein [Planctomycetota bacterium]
MMSDWLIQLLGIEAPENTRLRSAELAFRGPMPWWLAVLALVIVGSMIFWLYRLEKGTMGRPRRAFMALVRVALLALLLLLLFRPTLLAEFEGQRQRGVVLLVDNSQSLMQQDRRLIEADKMRVAIAKGLVPITTRPIDVKTVAVIPSETPIDPARADMVRWILGNRDLKLLESLEKRGPVRPMLFGYAVRGVGDEGAKEKTSLTDRLLTSFRADEASTRLADAVIDILQRKDGDLPTAIVVITDGQDNASKYTVQEAADECARLKVPLYVYGVGTAEGGSLAIKEIGVPDTIFVEDTLTVPLRWRLRGFKKGRLEVTLTLGGKQVAQRELAVQPGEDLRDALEFIVPKGQDQEEKLDLVAKIGVKGNPMFQSNLTRKVSVVDRRIKVLVIENGPRFEYKFLQPALLRDRRVEPSFLLMQADKEVANSGPPFLPQFPETREKFFGAKYNVIVLGDVAAEELGEEHLSWIQEWVARRGGLIAVAGRQNMPATYDPRGKFGKFSEVLPVEFEKHKFAIEADVRTQEYPPTLSELGQRTEMLALAETPEENLKIWRALPGFHWQYPVTKLRPGAVSLIDNPRAKMGDQLMPLLATQYYGEGQVLFMGSDETWRWRYNTQDKHFVRFWGQIIYQLGLPSLLGDTASRAQFGLQNGEATLNKQGSIYVRLVDSDFRPRKDSEIEATLEHLDAKSAQERTRKIKLLPLPGREGEYSALLAHDQPGRWEMRVNNPEPAAFQFLVGLPAHHELEETGMAEKSLRAMAELSGGKFYREEDLQHLARDVEPRKVEFTRRQEIILWNPLALLIFVALITLEWVMRKFANLS